MVEIVEDSKVLRQLNSLNVQKAKFDCRYLIIFLSSLQTCS